MEHSQNPLSDIWYEFDQWQDGFDPDDANADVCFSLPDGTRWCAAFYTYQNLLHLARKNNKTGELLGGQYFCADKPIFIAKMEKSLILAVLQDLLQAGGDPEQLFTRAEPETTGETGYLYADRNENGNISLHDCRAEAMHIGDRTLTFCFKEGFSVTADGNLYQTGEAEVRFHTLYRDINAAMTVSLFTETEDPDKSFRESVSPAAFADMLSGGMKLEFLYAYQGEQAWLFHCWLWSHEEPHHRECELLIAADSVTYYWNTLYPD